MKKNLLFLLMAFVTLNFAACSDDDDKKEDLSGTYKGKLTVLVGTTTMSELDNQSIDLIRTDDTHYTLKLENFKFNENITVPLIQVNTTIAENGTITGSASDITVFGELKADVTVSGSVISNKADLNINVTAPLAESADPIQMTVKFNGTKQ